MSAAGKALRVAGGTDDMPELAWLPVDRLTVDASYQRSIAGRRSQRLIAKIAAEFAWSRFGCAMAVLSDDKEDDGWTLIDGQHRVAGARLAGIRHVPAVVLPASSAAAAALDFIAVNRDRVAMHPLMVHRALVRAGDPAALEIEAVCQGAGVDLVKYPKPKSAMAPRETAALRAIRKILESHGARRAAALLKRLADALADQPGMLQARIIVGAAELTEGGVAMGLVAVALADAEDLLRAAIHRQELTFQDKVTGEIAARAAGVGATRQRACLGCQHKFYSTGPGHRLCDSCRRNS